MILPDKRFDRVILLLLIAFQAVLCYNFYAREIAWYPPGNFDQGRYLLEAYRIQEGIRETGVRELVRAIGSRGHFTTLALPIEGALSGLVVGGARLPQLFVLFLTFCALQVVAFTTARAVWQSRASGYMLLGLVLCQITPWFWAGGMFDFRMDFSAYCFYGMWVCAAIRSNLFLDRRWAIGSGLIGALLVLHRFLTLVYLGGVSAAFAAFCIVILFLWRAERGLVERMRRRLYNLILSVGVLAAVVTPFFIRNWAEIYQYYIVGHGVGQEKYARAHQSGITNLTQHLLFYPTSILRDHWGLFFILGSVFAIVSSLIARRMDQHRAPDKTAAGLDETFGLQIIFLLCAILWPIAVLTSDADKSPVVGGIVGVPAALLVVVLVSRVAQVHRENESSRIRKFVFACSLVILALGVANVFEHLIRHQPEYAERRDLNRLVELDTWLVDYAKDRGWSNPQISFDVLSPWFDAASFTTTGFEKLGEFIDFQPMLGNGIMGVDRAEALSLLAKSDFLILTAEPKTGVDPKELSLEASSAAIQEIPSLKLHLFPFYEHISQYWSDLKDWADKNMILAKTVQFNNFTAMVYVRPTAPLSGLSGEAR
jgi:hypothetical protein